MIVVAAVAIVMAAGCSSPGPGSAGASASDGNSTGSSTPSGTPIRIMVDALVGNPLGSFPETFAAAKAAASAINRSGGVHGHPLNIDTCNDQFTPNAATACARQAVTNGDVAYAGFDLLSPVVYPVLREANIPSTLVAIATTDVRTPLEFPVTGAGVTEFYGHAYAAAKAGAKTAAMVIPEIPGYQDDIHDEQLTADAAGLKIVKVVSVPSSQTTFSATVQELRSANVDAVLNLLTPGAQALLVQTANSVAFSPIWVSDFAGQNPTSLSKIVALTNREWVESTLPPATASTTFPGIKEFNKEMDAAVSAGDADAGEKGRSEIAVNTWLQVHGLAKVAETISGPITAQSLSAALKGARPLDLYGLTSWAPGGPQGPASVPAITDGGAIYYGPVKDGKYTPVSTKAVKLFDLINLR